MADYIVDDEFIPLPEEPLDDDAPIYMVQFRQMLREIDELTHYSMTRYKKIFEINRKIRVGELIEFQRLEETALVKTLREEIRVCKLALRVKPTPIPRDSSPESIPSPTRKRRQRRRKSAPLPNINVWHNAQTDEDRSTEMHRPNHGHDTNYGSDTSIPANMKTSSPGEFFSEVLKRDSANVKPLKYIDSTEVIPPHIHALRTRTKVLQSPYAHTNLIPVVNDEVIAYCNRFKIPLRNIAELPVTLKLIDIKATDEIELEYQINNFNDNITGHVIKIYNVPGNGRPYSNALIHCPLKCVPLLELQGRMHLEGYMARFFEVLNLKQCFKCASYNHSTGRCIAPPTCKTCSSTNIHNELECLPFCKHCHKEGFVSNHKHRAHNCKSHLNAITKCKNLVFQLEQLN